MGLTATSAIRPRSSLTVSNLTLAKRGRLAYFEPKSSKLRRRPQAWYCSTIRRSSSLSTFSPPSVISSSRASEGTSGYRLCMASTDARVEGWAMVTRERFTETGTVSHPAFFHWLIWAREHSNTMRSSSRMAPSSSKNSINWEGRTIEPSSAIPRTRASAPDSFPVRISSFG